MEDKGLISKKPDDLDRRSVRVYLTEEGKRKKAVSVETIMDFNEKVKEAISAKEWHTFFSVFNKINKVISNEQNKI